MRRTITNLLGAVSLATAAGTAPLRMPEAHAEAPKAAATQESPRQELKETIDKLVEAVGKYPGDDKTKERRRALREIINPKFDFGEMARRSLGPHWNQASPEEQQEFVQVFSDLLARTYLNRIETIKPGMVKIEEEDSASQAEAASNKTVVRTTVTHKGDTFPINYKLLNESGSWKVYDVVIENIGLVQNYRNEFASIIRREKMSGLLERLREKNASAEA